MMEEVIAVRPEPDATGVAEVSAPRCLREVFDAHASFVCRTLRQLGVTESDMDDVLQEVFVVVHRRLPDYREDGRVRSWLYSIAKRVVLGQRRRAFRRKESLVPEPPEDAVPAGQQRRVEEREALRLGQELLGLLSEEQREVFVLYEVEEMDMPEVAEAVGCPLQTAYSRLYSARKRILAERTRRERQVP